MIQDRTSQILDNRVLSGWEKEIGGLSRHHSPPPTPTPNSHLPSSPPPPPCTCPCELTNLPCADNLVYGYVLSHLQGAPLPYRGMMNGTITGYISQEQTGR